MTRRPAFFFDFVCPASYAVSRLLDDLDAADRVTWRSLELRPPPASPMDFATWRRRARGLEDVWDEIGASPPLDEDGRLAFVPWTRKAHELAELARERDCYHALRRALYKAFHVDRLDIGRIDVLVGIGAGAGLDASALKASLDVDRYAAVVEDHRRVAAELGVAGAPVLADDRGRRQGLGAVADVGRWKRAIGELLAAEDPRPSA